MSLDRLLYLQAKGALRPGPAKILDIGPQNVYELTAEQIRAFVSHQGQRLGDKQFEREIERLIYFATPRPGERTTLLSEITDLTHIEYNSYDICPGLKTDIVDLNFDEVIPHHRNYYDVTLNFGTTEHVFNQWNSFKIIHECTKPGGYIYYQLPGSGYLDHGYYCYAPLFFKEMSEANGYKLVDMFFMDGGRSDLVELGIDIRSPKDYLVPNSGNVESYKLVIASFNVHVLVQKTMDRAFRCGAEIATAHAPIDSRILANYAADAEQQDPLGKLQRQMTGASTWRKLSEPARRIKRALRRR
jgi:SAM-dependent methyltransferase